jgi:hypothetical protein
VKEQAAVLKADTTSDDEFIRKCVEFVRDNFTYPLDYLGAPSSGMQVRRFDKGRWWSYFYNKTMSYAWSFPEETLVIKYGICIDTALLITSILLAGGIDAKCCLGSVVNSKTQEVEGYHAWSEFAYKNNDCIDETTIHFKSETIISKSLAYNCDSEWAKTSGIYYRLEAKFNNRSYSAIGELGKEMVALMGVSASRVGQYGLDTTMKQMRSKKIEQERRKAEQYTHKLVNTAFGER